VVTATRSERNSFDLPVSIDRIDADAIREGKPMINLSETLSRVPGVVVQNRQNYSQDLQISSRGFGSRAQFGVRGVRLYADGIPATSPDGQGQTSNFDLGAAERIEVMRDPSRRSTGMPRADHPDLHRRRSARAHAYDKRRSRQLRNQPLRSQVRRAVG